MKYNTLEVAALQPDYLGFIFYDKSKRDFEHLDIPALPENVKKVGVFVDADIAFAKAKIIQFDLDVIQLHGSESPEYIVDLKSQLKESGKQHVNYWKVFGIKDHFNFNTIIPYESEVDAFLFDTKGKEKGGNGYAFDWNILKNYPSQIPIILSGGIGIDEIEEFGELLKTPIPITTVDVNSKFEDQPGLKNIQNLKKLKKAIDEFLY